MTVSDPVDEPEPIVLRAALRYASQGLRVIPIHPGQKRPVGDNWQNRATTNPDTIRTWWGQDPQFGVGLVMGWYGNRCVFAIDVDNGVDDKTGRVKEGSESLRDLELSYGSLPDTVTSLSGGGGQHIILWADVEINNDQAGRLGLDLDLRGVGGQIVVWPTIHPNGNSYQWEDDRAPSDHKIARSPAWLIDILTRPLAEPKAERRPYSGTPRPGDRFAANVTWPELLAGDGGTFLGDRVDRQSGHRYELWARPGADHTSATLYYRGSDVLKVFTPNWPGLEQDKTYTRFGYWAATRYCGDHARAAAVLAQIERDEFIAAFATSLPPNPDPVKDEEEGEDDNEDDDAEEVFIDWPKFWRQDHKDAEWVYEPILARGRGHAVYAPRKVGKSLLLLWMAAQLATRPGHLVMYLDFEMTEADVYERLADMGYGPDSDLTKLRYAVLPSLPALDSAAGAKALLALVDREIADNPNDHVVVIIDTTSRVVAGPENDADTFRAFYQHTGKALKKRKVTYARADHAGKDPDKGQRGSSAKGDDVDVVWRVVATDEGFCLNREAARMSWVPERVPLRRSDEPLAFSQVPGTWPAGTKETAVLLDELDVPLDAGYRQVGELLKAEGKGVRAAVIRAAQKYRRQQLEEGLL